MRGRLIVKPAQRSLPRVKGDAALNELGVKPVGREFIYAEGPGEEPALVRVPFHFEDEDTVKFCARKNDGSPLILSARRKLIQSYRHRSLGPLHFVNKAAIKALGVCNDRAFRTFTINPPPVPIRN